MSPPALGVHSKSSSTLQNPNCNDDRQETIMKPPIFGNASEFYANNGTASTNGLRTGSAGVGRTRPRLIKVRKQLHVKSKWVPGEPGFYFFNPFVGSENGSVFDKCNVNENCFVFGASDSSSSASSLNAAVNLNSGESVFDNINVEEFSSKVEPVKFENVNFVFEDEKKKNFNEKEGMSASEVDSEKLDSTCFVFGHNKQREYVVFGKTPVSQEENGELHNVNFVFGASGNNVEMKSDLEKKESEVCGLDSGFQFGGRVSLDIEAEVESGKDNLVGVNSENDKRNLWPGLNFEKGESTGSDARADVTNLGFNFGATHNNSSINMGIPDTSFTFGASWFNSNDEKESGGSSQNLVSNKIEKMTVEGEKDNGVNLASLKFDTNGTGNWMEDKDKGHCLFDSSSKNSSVLGEHMVTNCLDEVKSSNKTFESCKNMVEPRSGTLDSSNNCKFKLPAVQFNSNAVNNSATDPKFNISDQLKNLSIDDIKNAGGADNKKSFANDVPFFVFGSNENAEASSNGSLGSTYVHNSEGLTGDVKDVGEKFESSDKNERSNSGSGSVGTSSSETFTFQVKHKTSSAAPTSFSLFGLNFKWDIGVSETPSIVLGNENYESSSASALDSFGVSFTDPKTQKWDPSCLKESLFPELNKQTEFSSKGRSKREKKSKTMRGKLKQLSQHKQHQQEAHVENECSAQEALNSPGCYSPMDFSPYEETTAAEIFSRETSMTSNDSIHLDSSRASSALHSTVASNLKDTEISDIGKGDEMNPDSSVYHSENGFVGDSPARMFGYEIPGSDFNAEQVCSCVGAGVANAEDASASNNQSSHQIQSGFASGLEDIDGIKFSFSASSCTPKSRSAAKRVNRKKSRRKVASEPFVITTNPNVKDQEGDPSSSQRKFWNNSEVNDYSKQGSVSSTITIQEACETWRLRGNHAYKNGDLSKAEDCYTHGINSVPSNEISGCCLKPLVICYSNRAATRMSLGKMRAALKDCVMAAALDPRFLKVQMRAANCHLALGEVEKAQTYFNKCLESGTVVCLDRRITIEAADGLQKSQKVAENMNQSTELLDKRTSDAALSALDVIAEALSISPYSERLLQMKAESMLMLRRYEEVIQLCEQTLNAAENNFTSSSANDQLVDGVGLQTESHSFARLWRWHLISKSYFCLGKLEAALDLLEKLELMRSLSDKYASKILESSVSLAVTIRALFHHKSAGNEAVQSGRYIEALEHYTAAISINIESRPFAAICFCNRAAAHQASSQIADAIADCSLAIALDGNYSKAVSRRATLHEMIRDYGQAASDLQRLMTVLENTSNGKGRQSGTPGRSTSSTKELRQARRRLSLMEEEAKKGIPLDLYLILGVKKSDTSADIKKAYRKAALRHHPDKAGQFLARSESGDEGRLWKGIVQEVHMDADKLFKMIGEAYAVLSDPDKRSEYDLDEKIRKASKEYDGSNPPRRPSDGRSDRRNWQDTWRTYGYSRSRW